MMNDCFKKPNLEDFDKADLTLILKFFRSPFMEKRLKALNEIKDLVERVQKYSNSPVYRDSNWPNSKQLAEWIVKEQILQQTFAYSHSEMMKRVSDIVIFLSKNDLFNKSMLDLFWESAVDKHDSVIIEAHKALSDLADYLKSDMFAHLYKKIKEVSLVQYDERFLRLARDLIIKMLTNMYNTKTKPEETGIEIFLPILNETSSSNLCDLAIEYLVDFIKHPLNKNRTDKFLQICIEKVSSNTSVPQYLKLFQLIMSQSYPAHIQESLKLLDQNFKVIDTILANFQGYMKKAPDDPNAFVESKYTHKQNIEIRLRVISSLTKNNSVVFNFSHFSTLWSIFVEYSKNLYDSEMFFVWLQELSRDSLSRSLVSEVFSQFLCKLPVNSMTINAYECFKILFLLVNNYEKSIEIRSGVFNNRLQEALTGLEALYKIALCSQLAEIQQNSSMFIVALNLRLSKSILSQKLSVYNNFISTLFTLTNRSDPEQIKQLLNILQNFLEENYVIGNSTNTEPKLFYFKHSNEQTWSKITVKSSDTVRSMRKRLEEHFKRPWNTIVIRIGNNFYDSSNDCLQVYSLPSTKSFVVEFQSQKSEDYGPKEFLSQNEGVQNMLFELLSDHKNNYAHEAWTLLTSLSTNKSIKDSLTELKSELSTLIDGHSLYKMLYCLLIVKELIQNEEWVLKFKEKNGFEYIIQLFQEHDVFSLTNSTCMKYSTVMIVLIEECFKFTLKYELRFIQQLFDCLLMIGNYSQSPDEEKLVQVGQSAKIIFSEICQQQPEALANSLFYYEKLSELIQSNFILCSNTQYSETIMNLFLQILSVCGQLLPFIVGKLFELVKPAVNSPNSACYWTLFTQFISEPINLPEITDKIKSLRKMFIRHTGESSSKEKNIGLFGLMSVMKAAIEKKHLEPRTKFLKNILEEFLFKTSIEQNYPKCKNEESRKLAFDIIEKSIVSRPKCKKVVVKLLSEFHNNPHWRTKNIHDWNYSPALEEKSITGFVGLKNIRNICYMNSTLQQLFNIPTFCEEILRCPVNNEKKDESNITSLQFIFSGLKNSAKQYMSPKKLCSTFKDWEGRPINVMEQMDADEFFNNLMDKLENEMKGTPSENLIKNHFGGIQITECIGKGQCSHKSERAEDFMTLPVQVKNKKSLQDSLESFVEGEILEGDNAYQCDYCETKVTALRRVCLKYLPNILIIALRRFEFDFDTMNRVKVNDYCEFPIDIDMEPYTQEGLDKKDGVSVNRKYPEDYYKYKLKGITIHTGTAESGHYYSYIENRSSAKWFEFNDIFVSAFDPDDIPAEAFGGQERWNSFYSSGYMTNTREKYRNAYLLFYEREHKYCYKRAEEELKELELNLAGTQQVIFQEVIEENDRYWRCKSIFSLEYFNFVSKLLRNSNSSEEIVKFCAAAFLAIFIRSKDLLKSGEFLSNLEASLRKIEPARVWVCELICVKSVYRELIVDCPIEDKCRFIVEVIASCFDELAKEDLIRVFNNFLSLFNEAAFGRNNGNYFKLLYILVSKEPKNLKKSELLDWIIKFFKGEEVPLELSACLKSRDSYLGHELNDEINFDKANDEKCPSYIPNIIELLIPDANDVQVSTLFNKSVMQSLVNVNHKLGSRCVGKIYFKLSSGSKEKFKEYLGCVLANYKENDFDKAKIYFRQLKVLVEGEEYEQVIMSFLDFAKESKNYLKITEVSVDFLFKLCTKFPKVKEFFLSKSREYRWIENWLKEYSYNQRGGYMLYKKTTGMYSASISVAKTHSERSEMYKRILKSLIIDKEEWDSDDEFSLESIQNNNMIDVFEPNLQRWMKGFVIYRVRGILAIKLELSNEKGLKWYSLDSEYIAPDGEKVVKIVNRS